MGRFLIRNENYSATKFQNKGSKIICYIVEIVCMKSGNFGQMIKIPGFFASSLLIAFYDI